MRYLAVALLLAPCFASAAQQPTPPPPPVPQIETGYVRVNLDTVSDPVFVVTVLDERPEVLSGPPLRYPDELRKNRITGQVVVQLIVDTHGRAEPKSIVIMSTPDPGFNDPVRDYLRDARFRPGRIRGKAVRTLVTIPFNYALIGP